MFNRPPVGTTLNALVNVFQFTNRENELRLPIVIAYFDHPSVIELAQTNSSIIFLAR
jgi:hypothetical protein